MCIAGNILFEHKLSIMALMTTNTSTSCNPINNMAETEDQSLLRSNTGLL